MTIREEVDFVVEMEKLCTDLAKRLPSHYVPSSENTFTNLAGISITSKIPSKIMGVIGSLAWRAHDFADLSQELFVRKRVVPAIVLTRTLMETTALLHLVYKKINQAVNAQELEELDEFIIKCMSGNRLNPTEPDSPNILTAIQHLEKEGGCERYSDFYNSLCEFVHPNSLGTFYAYSSYFDRDRLLSFGQNKGLTESNAGAFAGVFALEVFIEFFDRISALIPKVNELSILLYKEGD
jgi:hypothetical protein